MDAAMLQPDRAAVLCFLSDSFLRMKKRLFTLVFRFSWLAVDAILAAVDVLNL